MYFPAPPRLPGTNGRPLRHGAALKLADERSWPAPAAAAITPTTRYGTARAAAWARLHQRLAARAGWEDHDGATRHRGHPHPAPAARRSPARQPQPGAPVAMVLTAGTSANQVDRAWQAFLRRFDLEHTFRFLKQALGWTRP